MIPRRRYDFSFEGPIVGEWRADTSPMYTTSARTTLVSGNSDPIGSWSDLRGANHANIAAAGQRPTYNTNGLKPGFPGVVLDAVDDLLTTPSVSMLSGTIFVVGRIWYNQYNGLIKLSPTAADVGVNGRICYVSGNRSSWFMGTPSTSWYLYQGLPAYIDGDVILQSYGWGSTSAGAFVRKNKATATGSATGTYAQVTASMPLHFGRGYSNGHYSSVFSHVLAFGTLLDSAAVVRVETELSRIWRLGL